MKKRMLARTKAKRTKRTLRRAHRRPSLRPADPKDLRGAKGALLVDAAERALEDERLSDPAAGARRHPLRLGGEW